MSNRPTRFVRSVRCKAKSHRSGEQCKKLAIRGGEVCQTHGGGAPQVKAAAAERVTLAEALARSDRRPAWQILADALHTVDVLAQRMHEQVIGTPDATPEQVMELVAAVERASRHAKTVLDAGIDERRQGLAEKQAKEMQGVFMRVLAALDLTPAQRARVPELMQREVRGLLAIEGKVIDR